MRREEGARRNGTRNEEDEKEEIEEWGRKQKEVKMNEEKEMNKNLEKGISRKWRDDEWEEQKEKKRMNKMIEHKERKEKTKNEGEREKST